MGCVLVTVFFLLALSAPCTRAWGTKEMEMFDLVDELKMNFYDFLQVPQNADLADIKRAYRHLSVKMHPDKNVGDPEASDKFRQLVGVYEVLKDEELRRSYDEVLKNGLPDWRMPVFYYRKLRRMSNFELFIIFAGLSTIIHYLVLWGSRFEKVLTMEDQLRTHYKRNKARDEKRDMIDARIAEELNKIPRPRWHDILPFAICKGVYATVMYLPTLFLFFKSLVYDRINEIREQAEEQKMVNQLKEEKRERKRRVATKPRTEPDTVYDWDNLGMTFTLVDIPVTSPVGPDKEDQTKISKRDWTEEDVLNLVRAVARFPGGVPGRWDRIAELLNRTVSDVTSKAKELGEKKLEDVYKKNQVSEIPMFEVNVNAVCGESSEESEENQEVEIHEVQAENKLPARGDKARDDELKSAQAVSPDSAPEADTGAEVETNEPYMSRKKLKQKKVEESHRQTQHRALTDDSGGWTQIEQKQLEVAIRSIPHGTPDRWDRIAECVPTKTKVEVMARVKYLSTLVKSKSNRTE
ncbi:unnamed protein product [Calicophoron daubneyi]|uniref:DnaJ homolog subfamily C member 2 n=1 Tax=Calicophoron daubneyi TaxID=300641 RepID=A0AAV2TSU0_CALDB